MDKVGNLKIEESGLDDDGDPFVRLVNGLTFFGHVSETYNGAYRFLPQSTKDVLSPQCVQVACDIVIRYMEKGLKYGGPRKQYKYSPKLGDCVSEMGAYEGFCSMALAESVGASGRVIAIEPMKNNFRLLEKNRAVNNLTNITCVNRAVWDSEKLVTFSRRIADYQSSSIELNYSSGETYEVKAETLSSIFGRCELEILDFAIIQLNGAEINALRGLGSFLPRNMSIAARYDTEGTDAALAIVNFLVEKGYESEVVDDDFVFAHLVSD